MCVSMKKFGTISAIWYNHSFVNRNKSAFLAIVLFEVMSKSNYGVWYVCFKCHAKLSYPYDSTLMITLGPPMMTTTSPNCILHIQCSSNWNKFTNCLIIFMFYLLLSYYIWTYWNTLMSVICILYYSADIVFIGYDTKTKLCSRIELGDGNLAIT